MEFSQATGERLSKPYDQVFEPKDFERYMKRSLEAQGYTVIILHDPNVKVSPKAEGKPVSSADSAADKK